MRNEERLYRNKLGQDPAHLAETNEPHCGYIGDSHRFYAPSPVAAKLMDECISFTYAWFLSFERSAAERWNRPAAQNMHRRNHAHCRDLNIKLLREYLPSLRGEKKMRAYRTIENLKAQQT